MAISKLQKISAVILAAGEGKRIGPHLPKVLYPLAGKPMISYILNTIKEVGIEDIYVVTGYRSEDVQASINRRAYFVYQPSPLGTGHAVHCALKEIPPDINTIMLVNGDDSSFYSPQTIAKVITSHQSSSAVITMVTVKVEQPLGLGRVIRNNQNKVIAIREEVDATTAEKAIKEVVIGFYVFNVDWIRKTLAKIKPSQSGELYIVDAIKVACDENKTINVFNLTDQNEWKGVNTQEQLSIANNQMLDLLHVEVKNKKNILFDLDDTLLSTDKLKGAIETKVLYTIKNVFSSNLTDEEVKSAFWKVYRDHKLKNKWVSMPELGELLATEYRVEDGGSTFKRLLYTLPFSDYIKFGVRELLTSLEEKVNRVILAYGDLIYQPIKLSILDQLIDNYHIYEQLDQKMIQEIAKIYQDTETWMIDDKLSTLSQFSIAIPTLKTVWLTGGPYQSHSSFSPTHTVDSISQLDGLFKEL
ncbi:MAG: sugar phosphate nucleotidyltransferase [bacterium]